MCRGGEGLTLAVAGGKEVGARCCRGGCGGEGGWAPKTEKGGAGVALLVPEAALSSNSVHNFARSWSQNFKA